MNDKSPVLASAWKKYHESLETARQAVEQNPRFADSEQRAQAYYALLEAQAMAYNWFVAPRLNHPRLFTHTAYATYLFTLGGNCPDFRYGVMPLDGRYEYRLKGSFGDLKLMLVQVFNRPMGCEGSVCTGNYEFVRPENDDNHIEIVFSAKEQPGNWIPLDGNSDMNFVFIRRLMLDLADEPDNLDVEMIEELDDYDELDETAMAKRIEMAGDTQLAIVRNWVLGFYEFAMKMSGGEVNKWGHVPGEMMKDIAGSDTCNYSFLPFDIADDEAIVIEQEPPPDSFYWSFQLVDPWLKSLEFMHAQSDFNMKHAAIDDDGMVRAVICLKDPGVANWLDPVGRRQGVCAFRNYRSTSFPDPDCRKVKVEDLMDVLPSGTRMVTLEERRAAVAKRRTTILAHYGG